jgi:hypothetical protein
VEEAEEGTEEEEVADEEGEDQSEMKRRNGFQSLNSVVLSELGKSNQWRYSRSHSLECRLMMLGNLLTFFANQGIPNCRLFPS